MEQQNELTEGERYCHTCLHFDGDGNGGICRANDEFLELTPQADFDDDMGFYDEQGNLQIVSEDCGYWKLNTSINNQNS